MPDSGAVYQPTTVGYTYDSGGDGTGGGGGIRSGFWRIMSRHKISSSKWLEWTLLSVAVCFFVAGFTTMLVNLVSSDSNTMVHTTETTSTDLGDDSSKSSIVLGAGMMLVGLLLGFTWAWLRFFRRSKSPRSGITGSSGQYGPVLTELPSQLKLKEANSHDTRAAPLSDQEEETCTLMQDSTIPTAITVDSNTIANQIPG